MRRAIITSAAFALAAALGVAPAVAADVNCGDVVTSAVVLTHDLDCAGNGLIAGAGNVVIDLNGHTLSGNGTLAGVSVRAPHSGVTVRNGFISGFDEGVVLDSNSGNVVDKLVISGSYRGINVANSSGNTIEKNTIQGSSGDGIRLGGSDNNLVAKNLVSGSPFGISVADGSDGNLVAKNAVSGGNPGFSFGISVFSNSDNNVVDRNIVSGMALVGILIQSQSDNTVVVKNVAYGNGQDGIRVEAGAGPFTGDPVGTILDRNITYGNGDDGIDIDSPSATLVKNLSTYNGDLGIEAVPGVTDGGGNIAFGNGNTAQCTGLVCAA